MVSVLLSIVAMSGVMVPVEGLGALVAAGIVMLL
jgi:hypothetical protein